MRDAAQSADVGTPPCMWQVAPHGAVDREETEMRRNNDENSRRN